MHYIPLDSILIAPDRQRKKFPESASAELITSITTHGLLNPIILRHPEDLTLVAGERRLRALRSLDGLTPIRCNDAPVPPGHAPVLFLGDLDPLAYEAAELDENIARLDLTWQEKAAALARLHRMRETQNGYQTYTATAKEAFGDDAGVVDLATVSASVRIADHLDDPEIASAKTLRDAQKRFEKKVRAAHRQEMADNLDLSTIRHRLLEGDCITHLSDLPDNCFDVILTDPPYGTNLHTMTLRGGAPREHDYDDSPEAFAALMEKLPALFFRVAKPQAHLYLFHNINQWPYLRDAFAAAGWDVWSRPIIWSKGNVGYFPNASLGPRYTYECILFANKNERQVVSVQTDVIPLSPRSVTDHPAEKPIDLYTHLLSRSVNPGDSVLDPFAGSGPIFPAAHSLNCIATGIEMNPTYIAQCKLRMEDCKNG